jgi:F-type H+-transporting ATPase subunit a
MFYLAMPILNPLEQFEIEKLIGVGGFGLELTLSNFSYYLLIVLGLTLGVHLFSTIGGVGRPHGNTVLLYQEKMFEFLLNQVKSQLGRTGELLFPAVYSLFLLLLFCNLLGLVPYTFSVTAQFALTTGLSFTILLGVTILGFRLHGLHFFSLFVPAGTPLMLVPLLVIIETISYLARAVSLGVRIAANIIAGHILLHLISAFTWKFITGSFLGLLLAPLPLLFLILLFGLELGVAFIQAFVFVLLTCSYIKDAISLHE